VIIPRLQEACARALKGESEAREWLSRAVQGEKEAREGLGRALKGERQAREELAVATRALRGERDALSAELSARVPHREVVGHTDSARLAAARREAETLVGLCKGLQAAAAVSFKIPNTPPDPGPQSSRTCAILPAS